MEPSKPKKHIADGDLDKAESLLQKSLAKAPENVETHVDLGALYLQDENFEKFEYHFSKAYRLAPETTRASILATKATFALDNDKPEIALEILKSLKALHPDEAGQHTLLFSRAYMYLGMGEELWELAQASVNELPLDGWEASHWPRYLNWLDALAYTENWSLKSKVISRVKKYLKKVLFSREEEDRVLADLWEYFDEAMTFGKFKEASVYLELLKHLQPRDPKLVSQFARFQKVKQLEDEARRINRDPFILPLVRVEAMKAFLKDFLPEQLPSYEASIPSDVKEMYDHDDEGFAYGLALIKKNYKGIYGEYREKWDSLYEEKRSKLSRDARRSIKY